MSGFIKAAASVGSGAETLSKVFERQRAAAGNAGGGGGGGGGRGRGRAQLVRLLESWALEQLHGALLPALAASARVAGDVATLRAVFAALDGWSPGDFKVKPAFQCDLRPAVAALGLLGDAATPLEKLHVLRDTSLTLQRCVERHCEAGGLELGDVEYATDDILDMLLWVLVAGGRDHASHLLPAHLAYIERFHFAPEAELVTSRLGYYMANFEQVAGYFVLHAGELLAAAGERRAAAAAAAREQEEAGGALGASGGGAGRAGGGGGA